MTAKILIAAALIAGTVMTRFLPFVLFPDGKEKPRYLEYLGKTLPYAAMGLLVVYCLKGVNLFSGSHGIPELLAAALTSRHCFLHDSGADGFLTAFTDYSFSCLTGISIWVM